MPQQDLLPCDVYQITFPNWPQLHQAAKDRFGAVVLRQAQRDFFGAAPGRRGFTGLQQVDNTIAGFYVQEGLREGLEGNSPTELSPIANANFEKLFFAVVLDVGYVILQRRKLTGYVTMNYTVMVEEFKQYGGPLRQDTKMGLVKVQNAFL